MDDVRTDRIDSKFRFVLVASHRAEQIMRGSRPRLDRHGKPTRVAMEEINHDLVQWDYGPAPVVETEVAAAAPAEAAEPATAEGVH